MCYFRIIGKLLFTVLNQNWTSADPWSSLDIALWRLFWSTVLQCWQYTWLFMWTSKQFNILSFFLIALSGFTKVQELKKTAVKVCETNSYLVTHVCKQTWRNHITVIIMFLTEPQLWLISCPPIWFPQMSRCQQNEAAGREIIRIAITHHVASSIVLPAHLLPLAQIILQ